MIAKLNEKNFHPLCDLLANRDATLKYILTEYGYPPLWRRKPGFETLIHIILEQQVSLASAKAALVKLQAYIGVVTPAKLYALSDEEMKACYFSRQKTGYARHLANAIISRQFNLKKLEIQPDEMVKTSLKMLPGIGDWTADIYLMMALGRADCFPLGDIALVNSLKHARNLPKDTPREVLGDISHTWKPYRTVAAFLLWHAYLSSRASKNKVKG